MTHMEHMKHWLNGANVHDDATGRCCPDMSCCFPQRAWPKEVREKFATAFSEGDDETVSNILATAVVNRT